VNLQNATDVISDAVIVCSEGKTVKCSLDIVAGVRDIADVGVEIAKAVSDC